MAQAQPAAAAIGDLTGQVIGGRYRLGEQLGQGGMGVVYAAVQESLARPVALKVLQPVLAQNADSILRFKAEAERAGRLAHPHIVQILDFGHEPSASAWIAMELLRGESLGARIDRGGISEAEVVRIARETLSALEAAHGANLVHRDLKPDNIFLADVPGIGTSVKVLDFGIAKLLDGDAASKLTATGMLIGTPLYMAPEQARGDDIDQRADLYALGAVLYETLTGRPPFIGKNYHALLFSVLSETPKPIETYRPDISPALAQVIARAMAKLPSERWQSAHDMAEALRAVQPSEQVPPIPAANREAMGTAPTMATPPPLDATTPALGGSNAGVLAAPSIAQGDAAPRSIPATRSEPFVVSRTEPIPTAPTAASRAQPIPTAPIAVSRDEPIAAPPKEFRWRLFAIAGGVMASVALAFVGGKMIANPNVQLASMPSASAPSTTLTPLAASPSAPPPSRAATADAPAPLPSPVAPSPRAAGPVDPSGAPDTAAPSGAIAGGRGVDARLPRGGVKAAPARRAPPSPIVRYSGGAYPGLRDTTTLRASMDAEGGWAECWPRGVPAPIVNQGRSFSVDVAADGRVISAVVSPGNEEPLAFSSCIVRKLRTLDFGPTTAGDVAHVRVTVSIREP